MKPARFATLFFSFAASLASFLSSISYATEILKCASPENPPLMYQGADGKAHGIAVDIITQAMKGTKYTVEVEILPWGRALIMVQESVKDCVFTIYRNPEREKVLDFNEKSVINQPVALYANKSSNIAFDGDLTKLKNKTFAVMNAFSYGHKFDEFKAGIISFVVNNSFQTFLMVGKQRADLTISNVYLAAYELNTAAASVSSDIVELYPWVEVVPSYVAFTKGRHADAIATLDANINKYNSGENFSRILEKYNINSSLRDFLSKNKF